MTSCWCQRSAISSSQSYYTGSEDKRGKTLKNITSCVEELCVFSSFLSCYSTSDISCDLLEKSWPPMSGQWVSYASHYNNIRPNISYFPWILRSNYCSAMGVLYNIICWIIYHDLCDERNIIYLRNVWKWQSPHRDEAWWLFPACWYLFLPCDLPCHFVLPRYGGEKPGIVQALLIFFPLPILSSKQRLRISSWQLQKLQIAILIWVQVATAELRCI